MALTFTEEFRASIGGSGFACYRVVKDGTITSISANSINMVQIEACMMQESTSGIAYFARCTNEAGISKIEFGPAGDADDECTIWVIGW